MSQPISNFGPTPEPAGNSGFNAQAQMGLPEVLQMCCLSRRSGQITFRSGESYGYIYIQHGRVLHALCGNVEGEEAIYTMLLWPGGGFSLDDGILPHKKTVTSTWEQLLFEGARRADLGTIRPTKLGGPTITTAEPLTIRMYDSQPKLTITRPDAPESTVNLELEYTYVGRAPGNEICLPYPSISSRHCIFIHSGPDIVLRDLNSSNGTYVNGEMIAETVLRPGDVVQCGTVFLKFEPGVKRPKLKTSEMPRPDPVVGELKKAKSTGAIYFEAPRHTTLKLPGIAPRPQQPELAKPKAKDNSAYVKGESAINYEDLAQPEAPKSGKLALILISTVVLLAILGAACYYFFVVNPAGH
jgi:pSer/pThr/pTyr-binding forkhead associated (FHA) protein